jgi:hypothetical protein
VQGAEIHTHLCAQYGDNAVSGRSVYEWIEMFKKGWSSLTVAEHSEYLSTPSSSEKLVEARAMVLEDRRVTVAEIAQILSVSQG